MTPLSPGALSRQRCPFAQLVAAIFAAIVSVAVGTHLRGQGEAKGESSHAEALDGLADLVGRFAGHDVDGDGDAEIVRTQVVGGAGDIGTPRVVVLVEQRLLQPRPEVDGAIHRGFVERLHRFAADLAAEDLRADLVAVEVYRGPRHQDGRTVLALRRMLQACAAGSPLAGAVLVGHFPDALLVRTCNWRKRGPVTLPGPDGKKVEFAKDTRWLRRVPEVVAHKFDLVLGDLDGDWEARYLGEPTAIPTVEAVLAEPEDLETGGPCAALRVGSKTFADAFHVADGRAAVDGFAVTIDDDTRDLECAPEDRAAGNSIARPEIAISRIDARGVGWSPEPAYLDDEGQPRRVAFADEASVPRWDRVWQPDPELELRLLNEYLDRNHTYRTEGGRDEARRPAAIAWGLRSGMASVRRGDNEWRGFAEPGYDISEDVDLTALVTWLRRPALLRTLRAHSSGEYAQFAKSDPEALTSAIGGVPWSYAKRGEALEPSLRAACASGRAGFFLYRTLWANDALPADPYLMVHTGCEAIAPPGAVGRAYDHPRYGAHQHAESILFYTPCLALIGRAKVFYDEPRGFCEALGEGATVGAGWQRYFATEAAASTWGKVGGDIGRKRSYFWSVIGDFTLRLRAPESR